MDIDQLHYFQCLAETGNFTESAKRVHLSQPAFSRSIQRLEEEFGQPFFERTPRSVQLTDAGVLFQKAAIQILRIVEEAKSEISDDGKTGRVRVGAIPTIAPYFLPDCLRVFSKEFPNAQILVHENTTDELMRKCKQGEIDLAILAAPIHENYIDVVELFHEELLLVLPPNHPLCQKKSIQLCDIEQLQFIMLDEAHCLSDNITSFCRQRTMQPIVFERANQLAMVQELVALNHGISLIPQMARDIDKSRRRVYRSLSNPKPTRTIVLAFNAYRFQSKLQIAFREHLKNYVQRYV